MSSPNPSATHRLVLAMLATALTAAGVLHLTRTASRVDTDITEAERTRRPRALGRSYEQHVLSPAQLPRDIAAEGGGLQKHPRIRPPDHSIPAYYLSSPTGHGGGATADPTPHASAPSFWKALGPGGFRIPDAIATLPGDREVLIEIKCPSPWLIFDHGSPWAGKMQAAFGAQATAFLSWAAAEPRRQVRYVFCGLVPPWAEGILTHLEKELKVPVRVLEAQYVTGFPPAHAFLDRPLRELLTAATLGPLAELAPADLMGAVFDRLED